MTTTTTTTTTEFKFYTLFSMLILTTSVCSSLLGARLISLGNFIPGTNVLSGGILPFCASFVLLDIATNQYGYKHVKKMIMNLLMCKIILALFLFIIINIPAANGFKYEQSYQLVISMALRAFGGSLLGTLVAYYLNCYIFSKLYFSFEGRYLWLRCLIATTIGEVVFSLVSTPILFWGNLSTISLFNLIFHNYWFKIEFEIVTLPLIYLAIYFLGKHENATGIEYQNFTPLHKKLNLEI
jgi:uncharacterized integral membrane protein (TIGR00697 family)